MTGTGHRNPVAWPRVTVAALVALAPAVSMAKESKCHLISTFTDVDISGGTATSAQFPTGSTVGSKVYPRPTYLMIAADLTDADNGITNVRLTFTATETVTSGTFRKVPVCSIVSPVLTCEPVAVDWDPQTDGKNWWTKPIDWGYLFGKVTTTTTGHGALDTITLAVYGCSE